MAQEVVPVALEGEVGPRAMGPEELWCDLLTGVAAAARGDHPLTVELEAGLYHGSELEYWVVSILTVQVNLN